MASSVSTRMYRRIRNNHGDRSPRRAGFGSPIAAVARPAHVRWFDPTVGRWLTEDPLGLGPDTNSYRYCGNGPTDGIDPSGMEEKPVTEWLKNDILPKVKMYNFDPKQVEQLLTAEYQQGCIGVASVMLGKTDTTIPNMSFASDRCPMQ